MPEPLKNLYNKTFFAAFTYACEQVIPSFSTDQYLKEIYDQDWEQRELKERMRHVTTSLKKQLPNDYPTALEYVLQLVPILKKADLKGEALGFASIPDFVELYGQEYPELAIQAFEQITLLVTCEFAVRPFIIRYQHTMMDQMLTWSKNENHLLRRFSSEGCRPRLPWSIAIPELKKDPSSILPILENLKDDESEFVRRSVANNLNDISKDHPDLVIQLSENWLGKSIETDRLVKHACRTLLKQGNEQVMDLFGYGSIKDLFISEFRIHTPEVPFGDNLEFSFLLKNEHGNPQKIRLEYAMYYLRANGSWSKKVFKISEKEYDGNTEQRIVRRQSFKAITTRRYYPGEHKVAIIVNGKELEQQNFSLLP